ncbi:MAG: NADH-quinone oxidoreductase subunit L [Buchnera aphidicola (Brevicoryne brassicae)]|uniref:NADH-quinone oxidoreductase subunit L n=1 Tax=Buchnera aphidicola (Brevicoryne brassicae) TaxID=911343 RepID=A0AAJ5TXH2_9GAMM|nr:NADH-quinone oxidoreductase subunit L [Buchnera aphidicola]QCI19742.1 NADH-quinone oxidoreductase subunit L [Buchnera aphidicola (Brevicoryne brassicae)]WAI19112.1 MAG: NADH-quinone oxidoreductase subunit L [Buchnera aphidicola (Brevicoryne brassicae)]
MNIIFLTIFLPLIGFLFLSCSQDVFSKRNTSYIGIFSIFLSFIITFFYGRNLITNTDQVFTQKLCNWVYIKEFKVDFSILLDELSLSMLLMVTGVGFLINIFSSWYMKNKEGNSRFFAYTNLFIASMSVLVLADNFLFMYLGWEGVSVCSYLLIGFYYTKSKNNFCALKAFILTRISDVFLVIAMFLIYQEYGTFNFQEIKFLSSFLNIENFYGLNFITLFLLIGVIGKSAQFPLQTWLSDAMVGPTPVSALIHAATMVTAGVYLIARTHFLFLLTPDTLYLISVIGIITILISSVSALCQHDIKCILAYSTMSQIGYMFLALGVKAWSAAITHLIIHAVFKALLFLSAGSLIILCQNEKNIFKLGGLRKTLPFLYCSFIVGGASLSSFPLVTSGFYSKGDILFNVLQNGYNNLFLIALFCSFLTALYTFRMIFVVFHRDVTHKVTSYNKVLHNIPYIPLSILLFFSTFFGTYIFPQLLNVFPQSNLLVGDKFILEMISSILSIFGIYLSYYFWIQNPDLIDRLFKIKYIKNIHYFFLKGWFFDFIYKVLFINFYLYISKILSCDPLNKIICFFVKTIHFFSFYLLKTSSGYVRFYIVSMVLGVNSIFILTLIYWFSF